MEGQMNKLTVTVIIMLALLVGFGFGLVGKGSVYAQKQSETKVWGNGKGIVEEGKFSSTCVVVVYENPVSATSPIIFRGVSPCR
jgi:hypothetical protein